MKIYCSEPPQLSKYLNWSDEFRSFIADCLVKDPAQRISADKILSKHGALFATAADISLIKEKFINCLAPHEQRVDDDLKKLSQHYFDIKYQQ